MKTFLGESDGRLRALVENILDVIAVLSLDGTYVYCSASVFKTLGYTSEELVGKNALGMIHPADFPRAAKIFGQVLTNPGKRFNTQLRYRHKDGAWRWLEGVIFNMLDEPEIHGVVVNYRDVTSHKLEEEKTRQRAEQMTVLYKTTQDLVMERDQRRLLHKIVERAVNLMEVDSGSLYLSEPEHSQVRCVVSYRTRKDYTGMILKYGEGAAGRVAKTGKPLIIDDYPNWDGRARAVDEKDFSALLSVPMIYQDELIGVLHILDDNETRKFNETDLKIASLFANQAAIAVANARLIEQVQNRSIELEQRTVELTHSNTLLASLHSIAAGLTVSGGVDEILSILSAELKRLSIGHGITLYDPETDELVSQYVSVDIGQLNKLEALLGRRAKKLRTGYQVKGMRTSARIPFLAELLETGSARYMSDFLEAAEMSSIPLAIPKSLLPQAMKLVMGASSVPIILLPLKVQERKIGLMAVWGRDLEPEDVDIFIVFVTQVAIALDNSRLLELERQRATELEDKVNERTSQLTSLLQEKEILLREVYHRVKNNLQVINSLLSLQTPQLETNSDRQVFIDTRERVKAMALVHEKLYRSGDLARVDFSEYVQGLVVNLARVYIQDARDVAFKINVDKVWLGLDTAIPCGLILNELVANSFKHAFPIPDTDRKPEVVIDLHTEPGGRYTLIISDNGVGMPRNLDWRNTQTMGLQLVTMLMEQLNGEIRLTHGKGTTFAISFSEVKYKERN